MRKKIECTRGQSARAHGYQSRVLIKENESRKRRNIRTYTRIYRTAGLTRMQNKKKCVRSFSSSFFLNCWNYFSSYVGRRRKLVDWSRHLCQAFSGILRTHTHTCVCVCATGRTADQITTLLLLWPFVVRYFWINPEIQIVRPKTQFQDSNNVFSSFFSTQSSEMCLQLN